MSGTSFADLFNHTGCCGIEHFRMYPQNNFIMVSLSQFTGDLSKTNFCPPPVKDRPSRVWSRLNVESDMWKTSCPIGSKLSSKDFFFKEVLNIKNQTAGNYAESQTCDQRQIP